MTRFSRHDMESAGYRVKRKKPNGKKRMAEWERRHAVPGATEKQSSKPGKVNRRRSLAAYIAKRYNTTPANLSNWMKKNGVKKPET